MNLELIIDTWLGENFPVYCVWSIPNPAYPYWTVRAYIINTEEEELVASIQEQRVIPTTDFKILSGPMSVGDPEFFEKFRTFMSKVSRRYS